MNLRAKVALASAVIVLVVIAIVGVGVGSTASGAAVETVDNQLRKEMHEYREADDGHELSHALRESRRPGEFGRSERPIQVFDITGAVLFHVGPSLPIDEESIEIAMGEQESSISSVRLDRKKPARMITGQIELDDGTMVGIQLARTYDDLEEVRDVIFGRTAGFALLGAAVAGLLGWFIAGGITRPVELLTATAEEVASTQDLSHRITLAQSDEVGRLARAFNAMLDALDTSRRQQTQLVQDANHELRTPLTSIRTNLELLQRRDDVPPAMRAEMMNDIGSELDELTLLVEELVTSATDAGASSEPDQEFELTEVAASVVERAGRRSGRTITLEESDPVMVVGKLDLVTRATTNLVNNAVKFTPDDTPIEVSVKGPRIVVIDHGPGVAPEDRPQIFDRFYRSVAARSSPGSGLGLAIVKQVAEMHGGTVWADETPGGGASIGFSLGADALVPDPGRDASPGSTSAAP